MFQDIYCKARHETEENREQTKCRKRANWLNKPYTGVRHLPKVRVIPLRCPRRPTLLPIFTN